MEYRTPCEFVTCSRPPRASPARRNALVGGGRLVVRQTLAGTYGHGELVLRRRKRAVVRGAVDTRRVVGVVEVEPDRIVGRLGVVRRLDIAPGAVGLGP